MSLTVQASDDQGRTSRRHVTLTCDDVPGDYLVRTDRAVYRGGDSMHVVVLGSGAEPVFLDLIKDGQTVLSKTITMTDGRGELELGLPPELVGTILLCRLSLWARRAAGSENSRVVQVQAASDSDHLAFVWIAPNTSPASGPTSPSLSPIQRVSQRRERSAWPPSMKPSSGSSRAGRGSSGTFFTLEQELLKPIYEIKSWSPEEAEAGLVRSRELAVDRVSFQQAIFARTAQGLGGPDSRQSGPPWAMIPRSATLPFACSSDPIGRHWPDESTCPMTWSKCSAREPAPIAWPDQLSRQGPAVRSDPRQGSRRPSG